MHSVIAAGIACYGLPAGDVEGKRDEAGRTVRIYFLVGRLINF